MILTLLLFIVVTVGLSITVETFGLVNEVSAASLTLTIPSSFSLDITPSTNGTFVKSESKSINVKTDNSSGYTLSIKAKNSENSNVLLNEENKLNSISEQTTEDLFKSDSKFNNSWGYLPSKFNNEDNTNFIPGPNIEESVLDTTKEANSATGTDYSITIGAKVDDAVIAGNYSSKFIINAVANAPIKYLQDFTADDCAALIQDDGNNTKDMALTLTDKRDDNEYRVGKLKDGKCWMLQGLRIMDKNISSADSDMADSDGTFKVPSIDNTKFVSSDNNNNAAYYYEDNEDDSGYYTWYTATAGTGTTDITSGDAPSSICPKGWRMPKSGPAGSDTSELVTLIKAYGGSGNDGMGQQDIINNLIKPSFPNYGYVGSINYSNGVLTDFGDIGYYWSSTAYSAGDAYGIYYKHSATNLKPGDHGVKRRGRPVRCVFDDAPKNKGTMQTVNQWGDSVQEEETVLATDERDNSVYSVSRLKDGKLWMTQNLRIQDKEISSEDSAMESGTFTIPASDLENFGTEQDTSYVYVDAENDDNGGYYSWHTATAGQSNIIPGGSVDSICPKGWHLPTKDEFSNLIANSNYTSSTIKSAPANFTTPGYIYNKSISSRGTYGYYWSAGNYNGSTSLSDIFSVYSSTTNPSLDNTSRYYGNSIRCIAGDMELKDYSIKYDLNGGTGGPSPNPQTGKMVGSSASVELSNTIPTNGEHLFFGWCTVNPGDSKTCSGSKYSSGGEYQFKADDSNEVTLYAIWGPEYRSTCNETGMVLKDGNCWSVKSVASTKYWGDARSLYCSSPWRLPSKYDYSNLIHSYYPSATSVADGYYYGTRYDGDTSDFAADWGSSSGTWWTSTRTSNTSSGKIYYFSLGSNYISNSNYMSSNNIADTYRGVKCVSSSF